MIKIFNKNSLLTFLNLTKKFIYHDFRSLILPESNLLFTNLKNQSTYFLIINVFVASTGFIRSFIFMKFLDFNELGLITLLQTGASMVSFSQFGLINGGYRIIAMQKENLSKDTNNIIHSYLMVITLLLVFFLILGSILNIFVHKLVIFLSISLGILLLVQNWFSNSLIANQDYHCINRANVYSALLGLICIPICFIFGFKGALVLILIQPTIFVIIVFFSNRKVWPTRFLINFNLIREILHYGFIPYLAGLFFLSYLQIERWSVNFFIGTSALGNLYIVFLLTTIWILVPTSINNIFFPKTTLSFEQKDILNFKKVVKTHFYVTLLYCIIGCFLVLTVLPLLVNLIFPQYSPYVKYALFVLPGLCFRTFADPLSLVFNSVVKMKPIFWSDITGLIIYICMIAFFKINNIFSLISIIICFNVYFGYKFLFLLISFRKLIYESFSVNFD